jgi:hypothetical protein
MHTRAPIKVLGELAGGPIELGRRRAVAGARARADKAPPFFSLVLRGWMERLKHVAVVTVARVNSVESDIFYYFYGKGGLCLWMGGSQWQGGNWWRTGNRFRRMQM